MALKRKHLIQAGIINICVFYVLFSTRRSSRFSRMRRSQFSHMPFIVTEDSFASPHEGRTLIHSTHNPEAQNDQRRTSSAQKGS